MWKRQQHAPEFKAKVNLPGFSGEHLAHFASPALECDRAFVAER